MSDLEDSAREALERVTALDQALQSAEEATESAEGQAADVERALEGEWADVTRAAEAVTAQIARDTDAGADTAEELAGALETLTDTLTEVQDAADDAFDEIESGFDALADRVDELRDSAEERLDELQERAEGLEARAGRVQEQVDDLLAEAAELFQDELQPDLADLRADVEDRTQELEAFLREECLTPLGEECDAFVEQVQQYQAELTEAVEGTIDRTTEAVRSALDACKVEFDAELKELVEACQATARALDDLTSDLRKGSAQVERHGDATGEAHEEDEEGFTEIRETLDHIKEKFGRFSFLK